MDAVAFVERWSASGGSERANNALFLTELCDLLGVAHPEPSLPENARNAYVFDRAVTFANGDGTTSIGFADLDERGFIDCETRRSVGPARFGPIRDRHRSTNTDALTPGPKAASLGPTSAA